jgi:hypothetical protein
MDSTTHPANTAFEVRVTLPGDATPVYFPIQGWQITPKGTLRPVFRGRTAQSYPPDVSVDLVVATDRTDDSRMRLLS